MTSYFAIIATIALMILHGTRRTVLACMPLIENERPVLFCQASVPRLPLDSQQIPSDLAKVRILGMSGTEVQHNGELSAFNLTGLETVIYLEISNFNLIHIQPDTFRSLRHLQVLDLSRNKITTIQPGAFNGLRLQLLALTDNSGLVLQRGVFRGTEVHNLAARNCQLKHLDYDTIAEAKPKQLGLSKNQITWLDPRFEKIIKPWSSTSTSSSSNLEDWGFIDLSDNPLTCNCQLLWLSKLLEEQLFTMQHETMRQLNNREKNKLAEHSSFAEPNPNMKRMYQLNLTCGSPPELFGKPLPQSWRLFCPNPRVVGIDISLLTMHADHAQLTCTAEGKPAPSLAWTYRINGHKLQKTFDSTTRMSTRGDVSLPTPVRQPVRDTSDFLSQRSISLNVSLKEPMAKNFTCTVWNDDSPRVWNDNHGFQIGDRLGSAGLHVPNGETEDSTVRMHEVTVRIHGLVGSSPVSVIQPASFEDILFTTGFQNQSTTELVPMNTESSPDYTVPSNPPGSYEYLFTERFSLLQMLGAVFGTFIVTLALLYTLTHFLHCFCQLPPFPLKELHRSTSARKSRKGWIGLPKSKEGITLINSEQNHKTPPHDPNFSKTMNCDSAFSLLTAGTNGHGTNPGPSTMPVRRQPIPQALLLGGLPLPPIDRNSVTPPPNPAYWPMPEYTYTGTGSHEYDVPRPIESLVDSQTLLKPTVPETSLFSTVAASGLNLTSPSSIHGSEHMLKQLTNGIHTTQNLSTLNTQWPLNMNSTSLPNPFLVFGQTGNTGLTTLHALQERQLPSINYAQYPSSQSFVYNADYPTYLQTRPYPHHQQQIQPLLEMMNHTQRFPPLSEERATSRIFTQTHDSNPTSDSHTAETNSSRTGSTS